MKFDLVNRFRGCIHAMVRRFSSRQDEHCGDHAKTTSQPSEALADEMHQAQKMAVVGQLACGIAHDFNNSLQVTKAALALGGRHLNQKRTQECQELLQHASDSLDRASHLSRRLLDLASPRQDFPQPMDVNGAIKGMEQLLGCALGSAIKVTMVLEAHALRVGCAVHEFENVLLNLAVNAKDAMPAGGHLRISSYRADLDAQRAGLDPGPYIGVDVTDTGSGMEPSIVKAAFQAFFTTKPPGRGTGLGLAMVKSFVDGHRGRAEIVSAPGQGTTVRMFLPANCSVFPG